MVKKTREDIVKMSNSDLNHLSRYASTHEELELASEEMYTRNMKRELEHNFKYGSTEVSRRAERQLRKMGVKVEEL